MSQEQEFVWNGEVLKGRILKAGMRGVDLAMEFLLEEAVKIVPHEDGILQDSGKVVPATEDMIGAVVFDTDYAVVQHERLDFIHPNGRESKYLEKPFLANGDKFLQIIGEQIKHVLGGNA